MILFPIHILGHFREVMPSSVLMKLALLTVFIVDYFTVFGIFGMSAAISLSHLGMIMTNTTTLEGMRGPPGFNDTLRTKGQYNLTILYNLRQFYSSPGWLFPLQGAYNNKYEGKNTSPLKSFVLQLLTVRLLLPQDWHTQRRIVFYLRRKQCSHV